MSTVKITAQDVKKLRDMTGAGMMDCKQALTEAEGDFDAAVDILRKKGQKLSAKRAEREAKEGVVVALVDDAKSRGVVIRLSCETDFVAKNEDFVKFTEKVTQLALDKKPGGKEEILALNYGSITVGEAIVEQVGKIGEKIELAEYMRLEAPLVVSYIHFGNRAGVVVGLNKTGEKIEEAGKMVAMQIAAMRPIAVDKDDISAEVIEKEIEIGKEQARAEGKPEAILEKIALGKLNKFYQESTLLNQAFISDQKISVKQYLQSVDKELTVTGFCHTENG
nr:elongation factor Ts [Saprospiraceae bacterium]